MTDRPAIEVHNLVKSYGSVRAVQGVSFRVGRGEIVGYLGPNGAGKSTTIKILIGMLRADAGSCRVAGFDAQSDPVEVKRRIGYVPESGALYESLTPYEFLQMHGRLRGMTDGSLDETIERYLTLFNIREKVFAPMVSFSKGMKQKIVITSALMHDPEVLIFDEPLNGLDVHTTLKIKDLIKERAAKGVTVFYSTHILDVAEKICDRVIILDQGRVAVDDRMERLLDLAQDASLESIFRNLTRPPEAVS